MLLMIHKVKPRDNMQEHPRVPRISRSYALDVGRCGRDAVERLPGFDFADHFAHIEGDFAGVFSEAVEADCEGRGER